MTSPKLLHPCFQYCDIDPDAGRCNGCGHTFDDVLTWGQLTPERRDEADREAKAFLAARAGTEARQSAPSTPDIRPLAGHERAAVFALICTDLLDEPDPTTPSDDVAAADVRALNAELDRHLAGDPALHFVVAVEDAEIIGAAAVTESFLARPGVWEFGWQVVRGDRRGHGIGRALLCHAEAYARDQGAEIILLSSGQPAHHQRAGYRIVAESDNEIIMVKTL